MENNIPNSLASLKNPETCRKIFDNGYQPEDVRKAKTAGSPTCMRYDTEFKFNDNIERLTVDPTEKKKSLAELEVRLRAAVNGFWEWDDKKRTHVYKSKKETMEIE